MYHPYGDLIDLTIDLQKNGYSKCSLEVREKHFNPHGVVHGAVLYSLADTGMGAALYPDLNKEQICATIEIKINYFKSIASGIVVCESEVINRGKTIVNIESKIFSDEKLIAKANGNYSIFVKSYP